MITIEIWRACGLGFIIFLAGFGVGGGIGKGIGWQQAVRFLRPDLARKK